MLSAEDNDRLTRVGRKTPAGELMRRYWHPVAAVAQLDAHPTLLMGEDLVLYRDTTGRYGLLDSHCAHRRADLCYGIVEDRGLRCHHPGWLYDGRGACFEQPLEEVGLPDARFRDKIDPGGPRGGTREICNWVAVAEPGRATVVDYVPIYASPVGAAVAYWPAG